MKIREKTKFKSIEEIPLEEHEGQSVMSHDSCHMLQTYATYVTYHMYDALSNGFF